MKRAFLALALVAPLAGCAVVKVQSSGRDDVEVTRGFGFVSLEVKPGAGAVLVDSTSFGVMRGADGLSLGYYAATTAAVARDSCHLVVWIKSGEELKELNELLRDRADVCVLQPNLDKSAQNRESP